MKATLEDAQQRTARRVRALNEVIETTLQAQTNHNVSVDVVTKGMGEAVRVHMIVVTFTSEEAAWIGGDAMARHDPGTQGLFLACEDYLLYQSAKATARIVRALGGES